MHGTIGHAYLINARHQTLSHCKFVAVDDHTIYRSLSLYTCLGMMEVEIFREIPQNVSFEETANFYLDCDSSAQLTAMSKLEETSMASDSESSTHSSPCSYQSDLMQPAISKVSGFQTHSCENM